MWLLALWGDQDIDIHRGKKYEDGGRRRPYTRKGERPQKKQPYWHFDFEFPASRIVKKYFCVFFFLSQKEKQRKKRRVRHSDVE